jgi:hypothetical protein
MMWNGARRLDHARLHREQVLLHDPADREGGREGEGEDQRVVADSGADHDAGQRLHRGDEDDERDRPEGVHHEVEHPEHPAVLEEVAATGDVEPEPEDQAEQAADEHRDADDVEGLPDGGPEVGQQFDQAVHVMPPP